jgi:hypothetical protein
MELKNLVLKAQYILNKYWYIGKVKVKVTLEQATKTQKGSRGIALLFL